MFQFDHERVLANVRHAETEDLLDRITAYRAGMEPAAIAIIETELRDRGVTPAEIAAHDARCRQETIYLQDGTAARCHFCHNPAVAQGWGWHYLWGNVPVFPRFFRYCREHCPSRLLEREEGA